MSPFQHFTRQPILYVNKKFSECKSEYLIKLHKQNTQLSTTNTQVLLLGEYTFWIIKLSLWIQLFIIILYPSISMIILLVKMSTLSDINIVNPAFLLICVSMVYLFHLLIFNLFVFLILLFFIFI